MNITVQAQGRAHFVDIQGRITLETMAGIQAKVEPYLKEGARSFVLRMVNVVDFSSTGIAALLKLQRKVGEHGGAFALLEPSPIVDYVLELARMQDLFRIYRSEEEALRDFAGRAALATENEGADTIPSGPPTTPTASESPGPLTGTTPGGGRPAGALEQESLFDPLDTRL